YIPISLHDALPIFPKCACILRVTHLRTPAYGLRQHGCGNASGCALQKTPDEGAANAETHHRELVDPQMIHQAELVVGIGLPRPLDLDRAGGLAARGVAQVRRDAAIFSLELLYPIKGRVAGKEGNSRVQPSARKQ